MKFKFSLVAMMAGMLLLPLAGNANKSEVAVKAQNKADFSAVVTAVKAEMVPGGRYEFVNSSERKKVEANLAEMRSLFNQFGTVSVMDKDAKFKLYVDQENVNAILTQRDDRRMICQSERPTGSLIPKRTCRTYGAIQRDRQNSQEEMIRIARPGYVGDTKNPTTLRARSLGANQH